MFTHKDVGSVYFYIPNIYILNYKSCKGSQTNRNNIHELNDKKKMYEIHCFKFDIFTLQLPTKMLRNEDYARY